MAEQPLLPNEREISYEHIHLWFERNKTRVVAMSFLLIAFAVGFAIWKYQTDQAEQKARTAFAQAKSPEMIEKIIQDYPQSPSAAVAAMMLADIHFQKHEWEKANTLYQQVVDHFPKSNLVSAARYGLASVLEANHKISEALAAYKEIADKDPSSFQAPQALYATGRLLEQSNQLDEARKVYEKFSIQYADQPLNQQVQFRLKKIDSILKRKNSNT